MLLVFIMSDGVKTNVSCFSMDSGCVFGKDNIVLWSGSVKSLFIWRGEKSGVFIGGQGLSLKVSPGRLQLSRAAAGEF